MIVLDAQGFTINKRFIIKELAAYDGKKTAHFLFKPPFSLDFLDTDELKQVHWLENNYHGLSWSSGFIHLEELSKILRNLTRQEDKVYVKGNMKVNFFRKYLGDKVLEFPAEEQPSLEKFLPKPDCYGHNLTFAHCGLSNVLLLYKYLEE